VKYEDYQQFVVEASHCTVDEVGYRLLRAASGLAAEVRELRTATNQEDYEQEQGDVLFWITVLDYWLKKLEIEPIKPEKELVNFTDETLAYFFDRIEKYTRALDKSKLSGVAYQIYSTIDAADDDDEVFVSLDEIMTRNFDKLTANPRERK
jgi:hypothetical protein